jgi:MmyB-like transcription regulator ligand binding domain
MTAAMLRLEAGRDPLNSDLTALIGELSTLSPQFRKDWADQDVHAHRTGRKVYRHPEVGELEVTFDVFELPGEPGLSICTYSVEEGSASADKFALLASWAATQEFAGRHGASLAHGEEPADSAPPTTETN